MPQASKASTPIEALAGVVERVTFRNDEDGSACGGSKPAASGSSWSSGSTVEHGVAGQTKDEVDLALVAPFHHLRAAVMAVAPDGNPRLWPVPADAADETTQVTAYLCARGCLAGAQEHSDRPACRRVVDMNWQETALVVMGIEQGELLMALNDINRIVDIERHGCGRDRVAGTIEVDHHAHQAD